eukprot:TRINITY_DN68203_c8_g1_i1.p1 TRINITY_DN68203_c8_g1~~TRINITY_DN68203_c8_g1_i1.p1  ORF type:complete len:193 (-),score=75.45 TRINITY_DN68203_c8_g1_i1:319-897(-)
MRASTNDDCDLQAVKADGSSVYALGWVYTRATNRRVYLLAIATGNGDIVCEQVYGTTKPGGSGLRPVRLLLVHLVVGNSGTGDVISVEIGLPSNINGVVIKGNKATGEMAENAAPFGAATLTHANAVVEGSNSVFVDGKSQRDWGTMVTGASHDWAWVLNISLALTAEEWLMHADGNKIDELRDLVLDDMTL